MRFLPLLLVVFLPAVATAERREAKLSQEERQELERIVGGAERWGGLPVWHQGMIAKRYRRYLDSPERKRRAIDRVGLAAWLTRPGRTAGDRPDLLEKIPRELRAHIDPLPPELRELATPMVFRRLMQLRLGRDLSRVPFAERRALFRKLFPEPFDRAAARAARVQLEKAAARATAEEVRGRFRAEREGAVEELTAGERRKRYRALTREVLAREEKRDVERVRRELFRFGPDADPARIRRHLERRGFHLLEQVPGSPRQHILIQWALRPQECPLLDMSFMGPEPRQPAERRRWQRDYRTLARFDLLSEAGFPAEMVLHLAGTGSPEELFRAVKALRGANDR